MDEKLLQSQNILGSDRVRQGSPDLLDYLLDPSDNVPQDNIVDAANTVGMQPTGTPINYLILAILMVIGGLFLPKKK
jgi:hypothetical protein